MIFNKQQEDAINTVNGNLAVIATAGSGKTTVLTHRIKNMVENYGAPPSSILAITFSRKAMENISVRLNELGIFGVNVETFHSFALKIISTAYPYRYKIWTLQWEKEKLIQDICLSQGLCDYDNIPYNDIISFIATQKINMKSSNDELIYIPDNLPFKNKDMEKIYIKYEEFKNNNSYIEYDDFLNMANKILEEKVDILNMYINQSKYVLVDEFQDISYSQAQLLSKLNSDNTMIVGDPLQAIYSFRGGDSRFILNFDSDYDDVKVINLNTNYRCSKDIVILSNVLASTIPDSNHKNYKESISYKPQNKKPELRKFDSEYEEGKWIGKKIKNLVNSGYKYGDIAILARTNAQLQKIETVLHDQEINFNIINGSIFTELPEIKLIVSYLKLAINQNDDDSFTYLYNKPNRWLNKKFLEEVKNNSIKQNVSLYNAMFTIDRRNWRFKNGIDEIFKSPISSVYCEHCIIK